MEGRSIQQHLHSQSLKLKPRAESKLARLFTNLMFQGNTKAAIRLLTENGQGEVLKLDEVASDGRTVLEILKSKHPSPHPCSASALLHPDLDPPEIHPVAYEAIDARCIRTAALHTFGAGGPSGTDTARWRRLCTSFKKASDELCHSIALVTKKICSSFVDPQSLSPLLACRLVALPKNPGVRPIGICEVVRRINTKAVISITRLDILEAVGSHQLCAGHIAGVEAAIHAIRSSFSSDSVEGVLLVDASNAFNSLNRSVALHNIQHVCPILAPFLINSYRNPSNLFVGGTSIMS